MPNRKALDDNGLLYLWGKIKSTFVQKENGKGLSANDYTTEEKNKLAGLHNTDIVNNLQSEDANSALSAAMGKSLKQSIDSITSDIGDMGGGDMMKATYDSNNDGVVDNASQLEGHTADYFVPAVSGKGLSTNDYTTEEKTKLTNVAAGAQVNVLETVNVNGTAQPITEKSVDITVPTNNNQLLNGAGYQTAADVAAAVAGASHLKRTIVDSGSLPAVSTTDPDTIYMLPVTGATGNNLYTEWMVISNKWEKIGSSDVDLTGYLQDSELVAITNAEIDTIVAS